MLHVDGDLYRRLCDCDTSQDVGIDLNRSICGAVSVIVEKFSMMVSVFVIVVWLTGGFWRRRRKTIVRVTTDLPGCQP